jgi:hypothetical protein
MFQYKIKDYFEWMIFNRFLIKASGKNRFQASLIQHYKNNIPDDSAILNTDTRLGFVYENLVAHMIDQHPYYEIVDRNIQIIENGKTHGEIDFVVENKTTGKLIQLECAVKFYLFHPQSGNWIGPNANDKLHLKYHKLIDKQLNLYRDYKELTPYDITESQLWTNGMLFVPPGFDYQLPDYINKEVAIGNWFYKSDKKRLKGIPVKKNEWIIPIDKIHSSSAMKRISNPFNSLMLKNDEVNKKFFVVADNWPIYL